MPLCIFTLESRHPVARQFFVLIRLAGNYNFQFDNSEFGYSYLFLLRRTGIGSLVNFLVQCDLQEILIFNLIIQNLIIPIYFYSGERESDHLSIFRFAAIFRKL